jgi:hypothetical protein
MIPIPVVWTKYTATVRGRVLKLVPCENCSTEYVYVLEREGQGVGTSVYLLNEGGAEDHAMSAAEDTLQEYLENDFDPVPCPVCGHYQRYMFPKLYDGGSAWVLIAKLLAIVVVCLSTVGAAYWGVAYLQRPSDHALVRLAVLAALVAVFSLFAFGLSVVERSQAQRFDPNTEDQRTRIEKGRSRAVTRAEFEAQQRERRNGAAGQGARADSV